MASSCSGPRPANSQRERMLCAITHTEKFTIIIITYSAASQRKMDFVIAIIGRFVFLKSLGGEEQIIGQALYSMMQSRGGGWWGSVANERFALWRSKGKLVISTWLIFQTSWSLFSKDSQAGWIIFSSCTIDCPGCTWPAVCSVYIYHATGT